MVTRVALGDVWTLDRKTPRAEAVAWRDGKIVAVGSMEEVAREAGPDAETIDTGATILPGFIDAHHHPCIAALYGGSVRLAPPLVTKMAELQSALREASKKLPEGAWLSATEWDEAHLDERRPPTLEELDDAVPDRPLFAPHYSCHRALANSKALALAGIDASTKDPPGGMISRDKRGRPDGLLIERGMSRVEALARRSLSTRDAEGFLARLASHHRDLVAVGITRVMDAAVPGDLAALYREADARKTLLVPTVLMPVSTTGYLDAPHDALDGPPTGTEEGLLTVGALKLIYDGAPTCAMCLGWFQLAGTSLNAFARSIKLGSLDPIRTTLSAKPRLGAKIRTGISIYAPDEAKDTVRKGLERGFAIATHAIGNEAIDVALAAYEAAGSKLHASRAPRLEHVTFVSREQVKRIAALGAVVVTQPHFVSLKAFAAGPLVPGLLTSALRSLLDAGIRVAGSSDYPVAGFDPLDAIRAAVTRKTVYGDVQEPEERVTLEQALALYTRESAGALGEGAARGTLTPGKRADVVVLTGKLGSVDDLARLKVQSTWIAGEAVFRAS